jgi:acyl carrier protein
MDIKEEVISLLSEKLAFDEAEITEDKNLMNDLGIDSLDMAEIVMGVEEKFGLKVDDSETVEIKTVGDLIKKVEELVENG